MVTLSPGCSDLEWCEMYLAHKGQNIEQTLHEHLQAVSEGCLASVSRCINFDGLNAEEFEQCVNLCGLYHDLGKYTDFFQAYLIEDKISREKDHAHISALFVYNLLNVTQGKQNNYTLVANFLCYVAVRLHHGYLRVHGLNMDPQEMRRSLQVKANNLLTNAEDILKEMPGEIYTKQEFQELLALEDINLQTICDIPHYLKTRFKNPQWFFFLIIVFSILIDQDKLDSAQIGFRNNKQIDPDIIPAYLADKTKGQYIELNDRREEARKDIMKVVTEMTDQEIIENRIFTLTAPTGIGKTLASLQVAAYLSQRLKAIGLSKKPRIITAIPFINIIEQTLEDYQKICGADLKLLAHYHLGQIEDQLDLDRPLEKVLLETEAWEADVILTTYVQLFQSLLSDRNRNLKKINKLAGSIVIMDEVQSLPDSYMPLIGALIRRLSIHYGTRFILMTATQPKLMEFADLLEDETASHKNPIIELLPNNASYFSGLRRTKFISLLGDNSISEDEFMEQFQSRYSGNEAALIVVNTIKRSLNLYGKLRDKYPRRVLYLSTNILPIARKKVIKKAKRYLKYKVPFILISTQTIEAGVDLDFDIAFRDLAPLPSLIQTAGRVNRNNAKENFLPIYIVEIENDCGLIYGTEQRNRIKTIFLNKEVIYEEEYRILVELYYYQLLQQGVSDISKQIWEKGIVELNFEEINKFELIKSTNEVKDVFVEYDDTATELADLYISLRQQLREANKEEYFSIKARLQNNVAAMQQYFLSIRIKRIVGNRPPLFEDRSFGEVKSDFFWIPKEQVNTYYDSITGFKDEGNAYIY
jgi:CRISPR-associated endonuclease/helicase Cas3